MKRSTGSLREVELAGIVKTMPEPVARLLSASPDPRLPRADARKMQRL
jgi:hypothetical protein